MNKIEQFLKENWRCLAALLMIYDFLAFVLAHFMALWLRFDLRFTMIPGVYINNLLNLVPFVGVVTVLVLWRLRLYQSIWRFASVTELVCIVLASVIVEAFQGVLIYGGFFQRMPASYLFIGWVLTVGAWIGVRFAYRLFLLLSSLGRRGLGMINVMLVGAGQAGQLLLHDARRSKWQNIHISCIIDDDANKKGRFIDGVPVVGGREEILSNVERYDIKEIYVAIPTASIEDKREILNICNTTGCTLRNLPSLRQLAQGE